ncbi:hypothetical protein [Aeromonas hydrophila]|uniref:hypothetical protein n=1 Tax=Aeromonas hydrophila TaxID=644 RepID=UPI003D1F107D
MSDIPFAVSQVAQVAIQAINASATLSAGGTGGVSVFGGVVVSEYGQPFQLLRVTKDNWRQVLGAPYHPTFGVIADPLRQVYDAVQGGDGYVVRVVSEDAKYPVATVSNPAPSKSAKAVDAIPASSGGESDNRLVAAVSAQSFGTPFKLDEKALFAIYPKDGNVSARSVEIKPIAKKPGSFTLTLTDEDKFGVEFVVEEHEISFDFDSTDDMGSPTYIESRLQSRSTALAVSINSGADFSGFAGVQKCKLVGGTLGDQSKISPAQYQKAFALIRGSLVGFTAMLGLGIYDADLIVEIGKLAEGRRIDAFADVPPSKSYAEALEFMSGMNINNHRLAMYHIPYSAKDPHFAGARAVWGLSGVAFAAKAKGVALSTGTVGGWHYSPAGQDRAIIDRREMQPLSGIGEPDEMAMYKARINKLGLATTGQLMIDDAITCRTSEDYLRFQHVSSVMDAISRSFYDLARELKHSPDGITRDGLERGMKLRLDGFVTATALVPPRNPEEDGEDPYVLQVKQVEIDLWEVSWACCVTGVSRRIVGKPALIR